MVDPHRLHPKKPLGGTSGVLPGCLPRHREGVAGRRLRHPVVFSRLEVARRVHLRTYQEKPGTFNVTGTDRR